MEASAAESVFGTMLSNPVEPGIFMVITVVLGFLVCSRKGRKTVWRNQQGYDERLLDSGLWCWQSILLSCPALSRGSEILSGTQSGNRQGGRHWQRDFRRHEPVLLHPEP